MPRNSSADLPPESSRRRTLFDSGFARSRIGLALAIGVLVATAFSFWPRNRTPAFSFELTMRSALRGFAQLYYDDGSGIRETNSVRVAVEGGNRDADYKFPLPEGEYSNFRFDPTDQAGNTMRLSSVRIVDRSGNVIRAFPARQIKVSQQIELLEVSETAVSLATAANADDPILALPLEEPLFLKSVVKPSLRTILRRFLVTFFFSATLAFLAAPLLTSKVRPLAIRWGKAVGTWGSLHPRQFILVTALIAVVASCYPIVFLGKSFLSPNNHSSTYLLYGGMPTVPGSKDTDTDDEKGSDLGAPMWYSWPTSVVEARALFKDFELPLWNRYNCSGLPLLGQGQSMFGDPLHFLVLFAKGSAGAWDLKYLLAKFLFAFCVGLCVLQLTRHLPAAAIIAASAPFIGFFAYRYSHPAFFSMCYAPAVLLCWLKLIDAPKGRASAFWLGMMVLTDGMLMNSGTVKEAYILLLSLNLCGCLALLLAASKTERIVKLRQAFLAHGLFLLIATPVWLTFLLTLRKAWTVYDAGGVFQISPGLLIGLFDDIFYRQFNANELHLDPSANFLILAGVLWFCLSRQHIDRPRLSWAIAITCLGALAFVFGIVPPSLILRVPFLGNIYHIDNTFSCVAIICLLLLAGCGIKAFWDDRTLDFRRTYLRFLVALGGLLALYLGTTEAAQRSTKTLLQIGEHIPKSNFFWGYTTCLVAAVVLIPWLGRSALTGNRGPIWRAFSLFLLFVLIHWKQGMHGKTPFDPYVMNPHPRTDLLAESPALKTILERSTEPSRSAGLNYNLFPGYGDAVGIEQIDGVDPLLNTYYKSLMNASGVMLLFCSARGGWIDQQLPTDLPLFDMLNVRYFLGGAVNKADSVPSMKKIASLDLNVYESSKAWPRAFFTNRVTPYGAESDFITLLKEGDGKPFAALQDQDLARQAELQALAQPSPAPGRSFVPATGYRLTNNTTSFHVTAPEPGVTVLTESYVENDFQLLVNGKPANYFRVNSAFRGVYLPEPGDYSFTFSYWPRHLTISLWISAIGIVSLLLWLGTSFKTKPRRA